MARTLSILALALSLSLAATGCASSVRFVARQPGGGILRAQGPVVPSTRALYAAMTAHCGGHWRLLDGRDGVAMLGWGGAAADGTALPPDEIAFACEQR
jgi:hypothetical protein